MSAGFRAVQWNRHKLVYDALALGLVGLYLASYLLLAALSGSQVTWETQRLRAFGSCAFLMLTLILSIGPLARLDRRFLPLLYNRRHLGVLTFLVGLGHALFVLDWYHGHGVLDPLLSLLTGNGHFGRFTGFPFEILGLVALAILFLMAATSHDFWLAFLSPPAWKAVHMAVYLAYGLLVFHIALGALQEDRDLLLPILLLGSVLGVSTLHILAAGQENPVDAGTTLAAGWLPVGPPGSFAEGRARIVVPPAGERIAIFRHAGRLSAVSNVCAHQNGPLGEGRIIDGCITCPWHGFQFRPEDGCAPPPFTDKIPTYRLRLANGLVEVDPAPLPPGTPVEPLAVGG